MNMNPETRLLSRLLGHLYQNGGDEPLLAQYLMDKYGSLRALLQCREETLRQECNLPESVAQLISTLPALTRYMLSERIPPALKMECFQDTHAYLESLYLGKPYEELHLIALDKDMQLIASRMIQQGSMREVTMPVRLIVESVCSLNAHYVLLAHNHPSESEQFSAYDLDTTLIFLDAMTGIQVPVLDHILYVGHSCRSLRAEHTIDEEKWMMTGYYNLPREKWLYPPRCIDPNA